MSSLDNFYQEILANGPSSQTLFVVLSKLKDAGQHKRVIQECIKGIDTYPKDISLRRLLAETYFEIGLFAQAEAEVEKLLPHLDDLASLYRLQATIYSKQNRLPEATSSLKLYLAQRPEDQDAIQLFESLRPSAEPAKAPAAAEEPSEPVEFLVEMEPEGYQEMEEESAAIRKEDFPDIATPTLAEVYVNQGQIVEALDIYERIVADNPEDHASRQRLLELQAMLAPPAPSETKGDQERKKKERMIATLTMWLDEMKKSSR